MPYKVDDCATQYNCITNFYGKHLKIFTINDLHFNGKECHQTLDASPESKLDQQSN